MTSTIRNYELVDLLGAIVAKKKVVAHDGKEFFGKVTICISKGRLTHIEKSDITKIF